MNDKYDEIDQFIVLQMEGDDSGYVIVNNKTPAETEKLYQEIRQWMAE